MTSSDRFPVPVRSAVKSNLTDWCFQNLSKRALNALTVQSGRKLIFLHFVKDLTAIRMIQNSNTIIKNIVCYQRIVHDALVNK